MYRANRFQSPKRKGIPEICTEDVNERRRESLMKVLNLTRSLNLKQPNDVSRRQFVYPLDNSSKSRANTAGGGRGRGNQQEQKTRRFLNPALTNRGPALSPSSAYITMMKLCDRLENDIKNELASKNNQN